MGVEVSAAPAPRLARRSVPRAIVAVAALLPLFAAHRLVATGPLADATPLLPLARLFDLALAAGMLLLAYAAGARLLRALRLASGAAEGAAFAMALGLGLLAYGALALGLVGLYRAPVLLGGAALAALLLRNDLRRSAGEVAGLVARARRALAVAPAGTPAILVLVGFAGLLTLLASLTPPHHWDPLAYHLTAPQRFLQRGLIAPLPGIEFSNLPLTTELLYGVGLAAGSDVFGQLLHGAYALITALGLWGLARRHADGATAWLALALFATTPLVFVWARVANNDLTLGCFLFLAVAAALRAGTTTGDGAGTGLRWLALAGLFAGLAFGTKYQAIYAVAPLGGVLLIDRWRIASRAGSSPARAAGAALRDLALFGAVTALVASPWYIKNWLLLDNPIWPTVFGGRDFSPLASDIVDEFLRDRVLSPRTPLGYLLLPLRAYLIGDYEQPHVILNPLFLLCPLALFMPRLWRRELGYAAVVAAGFGAAFTTGVQELRYLLAICPLLALITAAVLRVAWGRAALRRPIVAAIGVAALITVALVGLHVGSDRPVAVLLGQESRDAYLRQSVAAGASYRAIGDLAGRLRPGERALFIDEAQVFYLPPDRGLEGAIHADHLNLQLLLLVESNQGPDAMLAALRRDGFDYLLVNEANVRSWLKSDPRGRLARGKAAFDTLTPLLEPVYRDGPPDRPHIVIYRVPPAAR